MPDNLEYKYISEIHVFHVRGEFTSSILHQLKTRITSEVNETGTYGVLLNLEEVDYITSKDLGIFVQIFRFLKQKHEAEGVDGEAYLALSNLSPFVHDVIEMTKLESVFKIFDTEKMAIEKLK